MKNTFSAIQSAVVSFLLRADNVSWLKLLFLLVWRSQNALNVVRCVFFDLLIGTQKGCLCMAYFLTLLRLRIGKFCSFLFPTFQLTMTLLMSWLFRFPDVELFLYRFYWSVFTHFCETVLSELRYSYQKKLCPVCNGLVVLAVFLFQIFSLIIYIHWYFNLLFYPLFPYSLRAAAFAWPIENDRSISNRHGHSVACRNNSGINTNNKNYNNNNYNAIYQSDAESLFWLRLDFCASRLDLLPFERELFNARRSKHVDAWHRRWLREEGNDDRHKKQS